MFFDTHAHYDDKAFDPDREELLNQIHSTSVDYIVNPGCTVESTRIASELTETHDFMYFAAGVHPEEVAEWNTNTLEVLAGFTGDKKCVAIGEIGLDYYWDKSNADEQKKVFRLQLELACDCNLPVIIHDREAHNDSLEMIKSFRKVHGVFHCFSGSAEMAQELLKHGWYLGFDGPVTYKNARKTVDVLQACPLDRILIETDSPYMSPVPVRGTRNNSANLEYICSAIAQIKGISFESAAEITKRNGETLFNI